MPPVRFISLFSGVGGFDLGLEAAGWQPVAQVEWDRQCQRVLQRHWPDVPRWADIADVNGSELPEADAVVFGSPCQDLSVAGNRAGLAGERSGLFHEAIRVIRELRAIHHGFPRFVVWENVPGALTSNDGRDFAVVIDALADLGAMDIGWRVLDAQWFGIPQRRRRVFVVADFGGRGAQSIHPVGPSVRRNSATGHTPRPDVALGLTSSLGTGGPCDTHAAAGWLVPTETYVKVVRAGARDADGNLPAEVWRSEDVAPTLNTLDNTGDTRATVLAFSHTQGMDAQPSTTVWPTLRAEGHGMAVASTLAPGAHPGSYNGQDAYNNLLVPPGSAVRRLTPTECERLQGWPDGHTATYADGTTVSDSARYRMIGNGVAAPVAQWIALQINRALREEQ